MMANVNINGYNLSGRMEGRGGPLGMVGATGLAGASGGGAEGREVARGAS